MALLVNAVRFTSHVSPWTSGRSITPEARPASSLAATRGASAFPLKVLEITMAVAFSCFAAAAIMEAYAWLTKLDSLSVLAFRTFEAPYSPKDCNTSLETCPMDKRSEEHTSELQS